MARALKGLLWLQPVKQAVFKPSTGFASKLKTSTDRGFFSLSPESFKNCPNRSVIQRVLGRLAPSRYTVPLFISIYLSLSMPFYFLLFLAIFLFSFVIS
jgi:hypothetical protein